MTNVFRAAAQLVSITATAEGSGQDREPNGPSAPLDAGTTAALRMFVLKSGNLFVLIIACRGSDGEPKSPGKKAIGTVKNNKYI